MFKLIISFILLTFFILQFANGLKIYRQLQPSTADTRSVKYDFQEKWFTQKVDHFAFTNNLTFQMRYLYNDKYFIPDGPIFFYTGNEGNIEWFAQNTGFMWDIAPPFGALLVFAEHRYYGKTWPFGNANESFRDPTRSGYLTSRQALADFAVLVKYLRETVQGASMSPVILFGGSYGGMLAAWMRMKYPYIVQGALASSAPILQSQNWVPCDALFTVTTRAFEKTGSAQCVQNVRRIWAAVDRAATTEAGRADLAKRFHFCHPFTAADNATQFKGLLENVIVNLAMVNYPYAAGFLQPLPAWPVRAFCGFLNTSLIGDEALLDGVAAGVRFYFNYTGSASCVDWSGSADDPQMDYGWWYQTCTEQPQPMCKTGVRDMFEPFNWTLQSFSDQCFQKFGVRPDARFIEMEYGGPDVSYASRIIFSNGDLDPWSGGGVLTNQSAALPALIVPNGAHHLDLRAYTPDDPADLVAVRSLEIRFIEAWLSEYYTDHRMSRPVPPAAPRRPLRRGTLL